MPQVESNLRLKEVDGLAEDYTIEVAETKLAPSLHGFKTMYFPHHITHPNY
jgi:hypothetical protein